MKVANIIIAHKNPAQLLRLINQYDASQFHNFIHIDAKCDITLFEKIVKHPAVTLLEPRRDVVWAGFGTVAVTLDGFRAARRNAGQYFYINIMSGMDFPVRPTSEFFEYLKDRYQNGPAEFFEIVELTDWPGSFNRFERYHLTDWTIKGRYFTERIINSILPRRKFYGGRFVPYGRSAWFTASDRFADYTLKFIQENPGYVRFLKTCWNPDEFTFTTLIMNSPFRDNISNYLRYIDWSEGKAHPKLLRTADADKLLNSGAFIARKFDESADTEILTRLEKAIAEPRLRKSAG